MNTQSNSKLASNEAVAVKKQLDKTQNQDGVITFPSGVKVKLHPVGSYVVREAQLKIRKPLVPHAPHPNDPNDKTKSIENPHDPAYQQALVDYDIELERVSIDALCLFGIEIIEGYPVEDNKWFRNLKTMGLIDKELEYDKLDEYDIEFLYKKYVIATPPIIMKLSVLSGLTQAEVDKSVDSFRRS